MARGRWKGIVPGSELACPSSGKYPVDTYEHTKAALSRYSQRRTSKCAGGLKRICKAAKSHGIKSAKCKKAGYR